MQNKELYELNASQQVVMLQCKYTLFKRVINILTYAELDEEFDYEMMRLALNKVIERNDCLRLRFVKKGRKTMQYFTESARIDNVPTKTFATKEEQDAYIKEYRKSPIKYLKGVVIEPTFVKTYDGKNMILLKVCHLVLDMYGINVIFKDLFQVYQSLKNNTELPELPGKFEDVLKKDLEQQHNSEKVNKNKTFFENYLHGKEFPYYAGIAGSNEPIWAKQVAKGKHTNKMFFVHCDTECFVEPISKQVVDKVTEYSKSQNVSMANVLFYLCSMTASKLNGDVNKMLPLELCNCRGTMQEKKCAGTKVQNISCYTVIDYDKSLNDNIKEFAVGQNELYKHTGYSGTMFEACINKVYKSSMLETLYSITFSLIPYSSPKGVRVGVFSNGKGALPCYIALMYDIDNGDIHMAYDVQTKITTEQNVQEFHKRYLNIIEQTLANPDKKLSELKL